MQSWSLCCTTFVVDLRAKWNKILLYNKRCDGEDTDKQVLSPVFQGIRSPVCVTIGE